MKLKIILLILVVLPTLSFASIATDIALVPGNYKCKKVIAETPSSLKLESESSDKLSVERVNDNRNINFDMEAFNIAMSPENCKVASNEDADIQVRCNPAERQVSFTRIRGTGETKATSILLFKQSDNKIIVAETTYLARPGRKASNETTKKICSLE